MRKGRKLYIAFHREAVNWNGLEVRIERVGLLTFNDKS